MRGHRTVVGKIRNRIRSLAPWNVGGVIESKPYKVPTTADSFMTEMVPLFDANT
jgi:hypothetical protein